MLISRKKSIIVAILLLVAFFVLSISVSISSNGPKNKIAFDLPMPTIAPSFNPSLILNQFHREELKDGKKVWEISAEQGALNPETNTATITKATIHSFRDDETEIRLEAPFAEVHVNGPTITKADLSGGIKLFYNDKYVVETERAVIQRDLEKGSAIAGVITAPGEVTITSEAMKIKGVEFFGDLEKKEFMLKQKVETVFYSKKKK